MNTSTAVTQIQPVSQTRNPENINVTLTLTYADMATVEFALVDFLEDARSKVTALQHKEGERDQERATLIRIYQNRIKKANYLLGEVGATLAMAADAYMVE